MSDRKIAEMSFEDALNELEGIVGRLERGDAPLEESITIYQRGAALKAHCEGKLKDALSNSTPVDFLSHLRGVAATVETRLDELLPKPAGHQSVIFEAARYAALGGGKRLRPFLSLETARMLGGPLDQALTVGCALECLHVYSLVHDDLPCMDDDDLRRGKPTVHKAYDEAIAVLAGDALLTRSFGILGEVDLPEAIRAKLVTQLAQSCKP